MKMDTIAFNFFLNLPIYSINFLNMIKKTFLFFLIFYLVSCNNNEDYVGDWYLVEKNKFSNSEKINIKKAGDNGFIINSTGELLFVWSIILRSAGHGYTT